MNTTLERYCDEICTGCLLQPDQALALAALPRESMPELFSAASRIRENRFGNRIAICSIINAKSGLCPENCAFCAQSSYHNTGVACYPLLENDSLLEGSRDAAQNSAACFGIVTSGSGIDEGYELEKVCSAIKSIRSQNLIAPGASLGTVTKNAVYRLKDAGLVTYHHNLETGRSFFNQICTTHDYDDDVATVRLAKEAGLRVCSGGLFGMGESMAQRIELAFTLRELEVDSVPINFLDPVSGTPLAGVAPLSPLECLKTIAIFRLILPDAHITICGGRQRNLMELQSWIFLAGASGVMTGNYLTKKGRSSEEDIRMIQDQGLEISREILR